MPETTAVPFNQAELWVLQHFVRHEIVNQGQWSFPPASLSLSDAIAEALYYCFTTQEQIAYLQLSRGDLLVLDYVIPQDVKDSNGQPVGMNILRAVIVARAQLGVESASEPTGQPTAAQVLARLKEMPDDSADDGPDDYSYYRPDTYE